MTVRDLIALLSQYPAEMEVIETRCSDYGYMKLTDWGIRKAVPKPGLPWLMRVHPTLSKEEWAAVPQVRGQRTRGRRSRLPATVRLVRTDFSRGRGAGNHRHLRGVFREKQFTKFKAGPPLREVWE